MVLCVFSPQRVTKKDVVGALGPIGNLDVPFGDVELGVAQSFLQELVAVVTVVIQPCRSREGVRVFREVEFPLRGFLPCPTRRRKRAKVRKIPFFSWSRRSLGPTKLVPGTPMFGSKIFTWFGTCP